MAYQSDGRQVGLIGWAEGSAGWWQIDRVGREAALAPGVEAYRRGFARLLPEAAPALAGVTSLDQLIYREVTEVRCETWWTPGVALVGEAAHAIDPEAGVGAGLGFGDALALAVAVAGARRPRRRLPRLRVLAAARRRPLRGDRRGRRADGPRRGAPGRGALAARGGPARVGSGGLGTIAGSSPSLCRSGVDVARHGCLTSPLLMRDTNVRLGTDAVGAFGALRRAARSIGAGSPMLPGTPAGTVTINADPEGVGT